MKLLSFCFTMCLTLLLVSCSSQEGRVVGTWMVSQSEEFEGLIIEILKDGTIGIYGMDRGKNPGGIASYELVAENRAKLSVAGVSEEGSIVLEIQNSGNVISLSDPNGETDETMELARIKDIGSLSAEQLRKTE